MENQEQNTPAQETPQESNEEKKGAVCPACNGTGLESNHKLCEECEGTGTV